MGRQRSMKEKKRTRARSGGRDGVRRPGAIPACGALQSGVAVVLCQHVVEARLDAGDGLGEKGAPFGRLRRRRSHGRRALDGGVRECLPLCRPAAEGQAGEQARKRTKLPSRRGLERRLVERRRGGRGRGKVAGLLVETKE